MKKHLLAAALTAAMATTGFANAGETIKVGVILGFTGPIESLTPDMGASAELAFKEASDSGMLLNGSTIVPVRADSTCVDASAATAAAERLITSDKVVAIMGADCSGVTTAIANSVAIPKGVVMVSPSATTPALTSIEDKGFFFRTAPSDARQGQVLADAVIEGGIKNIAVTYTNNDYGKGLSDSFVAAFKAHGGKVSIVAAHEDGKADYSAEVAALAASGAEQLAVLGYLDQGGKGIIQASIDTGAFETFALGDGMIGQALVDAFGKDMVNTIGTSPGGSSDAGDKFVEIAKANKIGGEGPYDGTSYDAGALIALAIQAGNSSDRASIQANMMAVANAPGTKIYPGEIKKALEILAKGGEVDYVGA
ncbi:MAG: branched-chain amino acid transport system substrate-binding protein, partial [Oceanospirillaceae bacterium]